MVIGGIGTIRLLQNALDRLSEFGLGESPVSPFSGELAAGWEERFRECLLAIGELNARCNRLAVGDGLEEESEWPELILLVLDPVRMLLE